MLLQCQSLLLLTFGTHWPVVTLPAVGMQPKHLALQWNTAIVLACLQYNHGSNVKTWQNKGNSKEQAAHLTKIIQVDSVVGRAKRHQVAVGWAELHTAHVCLAVNAGDSAVVRNAPQPDCAVITAAQKPCWISLQNTHQGNQHTLLP